MNVTEQAHQQDLERVESFRYMDDDFMTVCLADNYEGVELIFRKARYFKRDKEGVAAMCKMLEDMRNEVALRSARDTAERLIRKGKMSLEDIAECVLALSFDELKEIEAGIMQL